MLSIEPTGAVPGATLHGPRLRRPPGEHGALRIPGRSIEVRDVARRFGGIQGSVTGRFHHRAVPEVGILPNIVEDGEPIAIGDVGPDWHTDQIGMLHEAVADDRPNEPRLMLRCQVMAERIRDAGVRRHWLRAA